MPSDRDRASEEAKIRLIIEHWADAVRAKDPVGLGASLSPQVLMFDLINPLQYRGSDAVRKRAEEWLSSFEGPVAYEVGDLAITAGEDVAFCHSLNHINGTTKTGTRIDMWWRVTAGFRKIGGNWMVTHEHSSVPFDMQTGKASFDLTP